jgi:RecB family exonuclease
LNLADFGSERVPLRPSSLDRLVRCPARFALQLADPLEELGFLAADAGTLTHLAVAAFHREPDRSKKAAAGLAALEAGAARFPEPEKILPDARLHYVYYAADPRNLEADVIAVEHPVRLVLPADPGDPTGEGVVVTGTLDQIRRHDGRVVICDVKTGKRYSGQKQLHEYAYQMAAYTAAARSSGWPDAEPGALILTWGYRTKGAALPSPDGIFWWYALTPAQCVLLLDRVRAEVARVRAGQVMFGPDAESCSFCPRGGIDRCIPDAQKKKLYLTWRHS